MVLGHEIRAERRVDRRREGCAGAGPAVAAERFESGEQNRDIAAALRVGVRSEEL
ncbi:hypothetical protein GCM10010430_69970 [Kitasatospora cystarginea]|uniref:Transposase n=1 Tax=Kitasatospora cystarginea TaxID=58350 RepID=A0ABN3EW74_9ACTN